MTKEPTSLVEGEPDFGHELGGKVDMVDCTQGRAITETDDWCPLDQWRSHCILLVCIGRTCGGTRMKAGLMPQCRRGCRAIPDPTLFIGQCWQPKIRPCYRCRNSSSMFRASTPGTGRVALRCGRRGAGYCQSTGYERIKHHWSRVRWTFRAGCLVPGVQSVSGSVIGERTNTGISRVVFFW
jgi:hypothetical protein